MQQASPKERQHILVALASNRNPANLGITVTTATLMGTPFAPGTIYAATFKTAIALGPGVVATPEASHAQTVEHSLHYLSPLRARHSDQVNDRLQRYIPFVVITVESRIYLSDHNSVGHNIELEYAPFYLHQMIQFGND